MNDRNHYHHLAYPVFSDTMFTSSMFRRGNKCTQVYAADFGLARASFPMVIKSKVHETLLLLFARDGVPQACICDNAKGMIQCKFYQKLKEAACHLKQL